jgi:membrane dipeptidase
MSARRGRVLRVGALALVLLVVAAFALVPAVVERSLNRVDAARAGPVSDAARRLHAQLPFVADLHGDMLLWGRDPLARGGRGHVDVPRLADGNVALQVFATVTKTPRGLNYVRNTDETDQVTLLAVLGRWPPRTWRSLRARALYQAARLHDAAARSGGRLTVIRTADDLAAFVRRRAGDPAAARSRVAALLATEGLQVLEGELRNVDTLHAAGFRLLGLTHFFDNAVAGSAHGVSRGGLTPLGREVVRRAESLGMLIDVAHASPRAVDDVLAMATTCSRWRRGR